MTTTTTTTTRKAAPRGSGTILPGPGGTCGIKAYIGGRQVVRRGFATEADARAWVVVERARYGQGVTVTDRTDAKAAAALAKVAATRAVAEGVALIDGEPVTIDGMLDRFLASPDVVNRTAATRTSYAGALAHVRRHPVASMRVDALKVADLDRLWRDLAEGRHAKAGRPVGAATLVLARRCLIRAAAEAARLELITETDRVRFTLANLPVRYDPDAGAISRHRDQASAWTIADVRAVCEHVAAHPADPIAVAVAVMSTTGLRRGEVVGLTWDRVHLDGDGVPHLVIDRAMVRTPAGEVLGSPKTDRSRRVVEVPPILAVVLRAWRDRQRAAFKAARVLHTGSTFVLGRIVAADWGSRGGAQVGEPPHLQDVTRAVEDVLRVMRTPAGVEVPGVSGPRRKVYGLGVLRPDLPAMTAHGLRSVVATVALDAGADVSAVAAVLGHARPAITQRSYDQGSRSARALQAGTLGAVFGGLAVAQ